MEKFSKFNQKLIRSSINHYQSIHQVSSSSFNLFRYFADKIASIFFRRDIIEERDIILSRKKYVSATFFFFFFFFFFHEESE